MSVVRRIILDLQNKRRQARKTAKQRLWRNTVTGYSSFKLLLYEIGTILNKNETRKTKEQPETLQHDEA
jgi:hypothetical protein